MKHRVVEPADQPLPQHSFSLLSTMLPVESRAPAPVVSALDYTGEVVVKEETVEPTYVESVRSSLQTIDPLKKDRQRTSPAEEKIIFGQPESYWRKILRPVAVLPENPRENLAPEPLS